MLGGKNQARPLQARRPSCPACAALRSARPLLRNNRAPSRPDRLNTVFSLSKWASQNLLAGLCRMADSATASDGRFRHLQSSGPFGACCTSALASRPPVPATRTTGHRRGGYSRTSAAPASNDRPGATPPAAGSDAPPRRSSAVQRMRLRRERTRAYARAGRAETQRVTPARITVVKADTARKRTVNVHPRLGGPRSAQL